MDDFDVCGSCGCHLKAAEGACPFCAAPHAPGARLATRTLPRLSRARLLVIGSTLALGCASSTGGGETTAGTGGDTTGTGSQTVASSGTGAGTPDGGDGGHITCYGAPPPRLERLG